MAARLAAAGCVAPEEEAAELVAFAAGDRELLAALVERRTNGEPLAWLVGGVTFCGLRVRVDPGVYVPRWQTEPLARRASQLLPAGGVAVDLCTGAGAIACVLAASVPSATVVATDVDPAAVACARANRVDARLGHLDAPLPAALLGAVDPTSRPRGCRSFLGTFSPTSPARPSTAGTAACDCSRPWLPAAGAGCVPAAGSSSSWAATRHRRWPR